jgi:hypothetical protein
MARRFSRQEASRHPARSGAGRDTPRIGIPPEQAMPPTMDEPRRAEDDGDVSVALARLRRALDAADPDDRTFVLQTLELLIRRLAPQRPK